MKMETELAEITASVKSAKGLNSKALMLFIGLTSTDVLAAGGFSQATVVAEEIKLEFYAFLGTACFIYMMYHVINAKLGREQWSDVLMALGHTAAAGGIIAAATWAWNIFA